MTTRNKTRAGLWLMVLLILVYFLSRLHNLGALPIFTDESDNIYWARDVWALQPFNGARVGHLLNIWWLAPFRPFANPVWISRAATVLFGVLGLAASYATVRALFSVRAALSTAALYILAPFIFFFDRLAVPESNAVCLSLLVVCCGVWFARSGRRRDALLCGVMLSAAIIAKASMMAFLPVPALAAVFLIPGVRSRAGAVKAARLALWAYGGLAVTLGALLAVLFARRHNLFTLFSFYGARSASLDETLARIGRNLSFVWAQTTAYLPAPLMVLALALGLYLLLRRPRPTAYLLGVTAGALGALVVVSSVVFGRYALMLTPLFLMFLGAGLAQPALRRPLHLALPALVVVLWALTGALPFMHRAYTAPEDLPLAQGDRWEYIESQTAGFARESLADYLTGPDFRPGPIYGLVAACDSIALLLPPDAVSSLAPECPSLAWDGSMQAVFEARAAELASGEAPVYLLADDLPYIHIDRLPVDLAAVARFPNPGGHTAITLYRMSPQP